MLGLECARLREQQSQINNDEQMNVLTDLRDKLSSVTSKLDEQKEIVQPFSPGIHTDYTKSLEHQLAAAEQSRREIHNAMQELKGSIRVFCRLRPAAEGAGCALESIDSEKVTLMSGGDLYNFSFDKVFNTNATQVEVFSEVAGLVQSALDGYKVCIFAYGQTGSGKTYTMQGPNTSSMGGLIPRSLRQIFESSRAMMKQGWMWSLQASFLEVYNESFRDLLQSGSGKSSD